MRALRLTTGLTSIRFGIDGVVLCAAPVFSYSYSCSYSKIASKEYEQEHEQE